MEIKEEEVVETTIDMGEVATSHTKEEIMAEVVVVMVIIDMIKEGNLVLDINIIDTVAVAATDKVVETMEDITEEMIGMTKERVEGKIIKVEIDMMEVEEEVHLQEWEGATEVDKIIRVMVIDFHLIEEKALKKNSLEMTDIE